MTFSVTTPTRQPKFNHLPTSSSLNGPTSYYAVRPRSHTCFSEPVTMAGFNYVTQMLHLAHLLSEAIFRAGFEIYVYRSDGFDISHITTTICWKRNGCMPWCRCKIVLDHLFKSTSIDTTVYKMYTVKKARRKYMIHLLYAMRLGFLTIPPKFRAAYIPDYPLVNMVYQTAMNSTRM